MSAYQYAGNSPVVFNDPSGLLRAPSDPSGDWGSWSSYLYSGGGGGYSAGHWSDQYHDVETNAMLMSRNRFNAYYGITEDNREDFANSIGTSVSSDHFGAIAQAYNSGSPITFGTKNGVVGFWTDEEYQDETGAGRQSTFIAFGKVQQGDPRLSMQQVAAQIQKGGIEKFLQFVNDPTYGPGFFLNEIQKSSSRNSDNIFIPSIIRWGFRAQQWGHHNFPNPNYDELRHQITSYLAVEKFGVLLGGALANGNEAIGLWLDITTPGPGSAFEWRDISNNWEAMSLWSENNIHYYQD